MEIMGRLANALPSPVWKSYLSDKDSLRFGGGGGFVLKFSLLKPQFVGDFARHQVAPAQLPEILFRWREPDFLHPANGVLRLYRLNFLPILVSISITFWDNSA